MKPAIQPKLVWVITVLFITSVLHAQNFHIVKDINDSKDGNPSNGVYNENGNWSYKYEVLNNVAYFSANDGIHGTELWRSDGTDTGTYLVKDINPGENGSNPLEIIELNGAIYFGATDNIHGQELWKSDGTESGTILVKDINEGPSSSYLDYFTKLANVLIFSVAGSDYVGQLWKTDGTAEGTVSVKDFHSVSGTPPAFLTKVNGVICFITLANGYQLWKSDGTEAGTQLISILYGADSIIHMPVREVNYFLMTLKTIYGLLMQLLMGL